MAQIGAMAYSHTNRNGVTLYLHRGRATFGEPFEFLDSVHEGALDALPKGYDVYEDPNGRLRLVLQTDDLFSDADVQIVRAALQSTAYAEYLVEVIEDDIVIMQPDWSRAELARFLAQPVDSLTAEEIEDNTHYAPIMCLQPELAPHGHFRLLRMEFDPIPGWSEPLTEGPLDEVVAQLGSQLRDAVSPHL